MNAANTEARILLFERLQFFEQALFLTRLSLLLDIAGRRASNFEEMASTALGQPAFSGIGDVMALFLDRISGLHYFLRFYWGLEKLLDDVYLQVAFSQETFRVLLG
jgi:hypothetical protein